MIIQVKVLNKEQILQLNPEKNYKDILPFAGQYIRIDKYGETYANTVDRFLIPIECIDRASFPVFQIKTAEEVEPLLDGGRGKISRLRFNPDMKNIIYGQIGELLELDSSDNTIALKVLDKETNQILANLYWLDQDWVTEIPTKKNINNKLKGMLV